MFGAVFAMGLGLGLCVGLILGVGCGIAAGISMEKKRVRKLIDDLVAGGELRIQTRQGGSFSANQFLERLRLPHA